MKVASFRLPSARTSCADAIEVYWNDVEGAETSRRNGVLCESREIRSTHQSGIRHNTQQQYVDGFCYRTTTRQDVSIVLRSLLPVEQRERFETVLARLLRRLRISLTTLMFTNPLREMLPRLRLEPAEE
jgi:hypothetical protein